MPPTSRPLPHEGSAPTALAALLLAREGTGAAFPAALARRAAAPGAMSDAAAWWREPDPVVRLVGLELSTALAGPASPLPVDVRGPAQQQAAAQARDAALSPDADLRWAAAKALGAVGASPGSLAALLRLVRDDDADVRWQAVACLPLVSGASADGGAGGEAVDALVTACGDPDADVAEQAVFVLSEQLDPVGAAASPAVADALAVHLQDGGERDDVAALAALGLARRDDPRAEPAVRSRLAEALEAVRAGTDPDAAAELDDAWLTAAGLLPQLAPLLADVVDVAGPQARPADDQLG